MSRESAKAHLDRTETDPPEGYITPDRHKDVIDTVYDDMSDKTTLQSIVADSVDFADFKVRVSEWL